MTTDPEARKWRSDWKAFVHCLPESESYRAELPLAAIATGDRVLIKTRNTLYLFTWKSREHAEAELSANNPKAPAGPVRIMGCSFGLSSSIRPDALFCGGNLEMTHAKGDKTWTTSAIEEIHLLHQSANPRKNPHER